MNPCVFALTIIAYTVSITKSDSSKNKYVPYNNAYNGGGPHSYYNKFPKFQYKSISDYSPNGVYGLVLPVKMKPKNKPKNKDNI